MPILTTTNPDVLDFTTSLVLLFQDGFTGATTLAGQVSVKIGQTPALFQKTPEATFVFGNLANGLYVVNVRSTPDQPYYLPADIAITLPFVRPENAPWNPAPVWPGYPDLLLADPDKTLDDPEQTAAYIAQRTLASLQPSSAYPFPSGATLVRGVVRNANTPLAGAIVTTAFVAQAGQFPIVVETPGGANSNAQNIQVVNAPVIDQLVPSTVLAGCPGFNLFVEGSGFAAGAIAQFNGAAVPSTVLSASVLAAQITAAQVANAGVSNIRIANPNGTVSNQQTLTSARAPSIAALDPATVATGSAVFTLTVEGGSFTPATVVQVNGAALPTTFVSDKVLQAVMAAAQVAAAGQLNITAAIPGPPPQTSNPQPLIVVTAPVIGSLSPGEVVAGSAAFSLVVEGSGFTAQSIALLNGAALTTVFTSALQLSAQVTQAQIAAAGQVNITVQNPAGPASGAKTLNVVAAPAISSIDPATVAAGSAPFLLIVNGSAFVPGSSVTLNGTQLSTTFISSERLDAHVPRSGYTTGADGTFVLFFDDIPGSGQTVSVIVTHPAFPNPVKRDVLVVRGATVSVDIDMA